MRVDIPMLPAPPRPWETGPRAECSLLREEVEVRGSAAIGGMGVVFECSLLRGEVGAQGSASLILSKVIYEDDTIRGVNGFGSITLM